MRGEPITITPQFQEAISVEDKASIRSKIERQMQEFFAAGGFITEIPAGVSGERKRDYGAILLRRENGAISKTARSVHRSITGSGRRGAAAKLEA